MPEKHFCGDCGNEFEPKPAFYGGRDLCGSCRGKRSKKILEAKTAYDHLGLEDRRSIDFTSTLEGAFPKRRTETICWKCGTTISEGRMCRSCSREVEREEEREAERSERARRDFRERIANL